MMSGSVVCQSQEIKRVKDNPDGSIQVEINGRRYLAVTGPQLDAWQILQNNYNAATANLKDKDIEIKELTLQRDLAEAQKALIQQRADSFEADFNRSQQDAKRNFNLFIGERELRTEAQQFIPHGKVSGFGGKVLSFLDGPYGQGLFKLAIPAATFTKTYLGRCSQ